MTTDDPASRAHGAIEASGFAYTVVEYGRVQSVGEAATARGVALAEVVKTIVVRRGAADLIMVLVPGDRVIDWAKLRRVCGVSRMSLATADEAIAATGYVPGTITPFGSLTRLPVIADASVAGLASVGGGTHGVAFHLAASDLVAFCDAEVADVTRPDA